MIRSLLVLGLLAIALPAAAQDKLTKVEIGKQGKAATAFVKASGGSGTAFCIHPSGLFLTSEQIVRGAKDDIVLVLDPTLKSERVLKAKVLRTEAGRNFALLRVEGVKDLPSLALGSIQGVAELSEMVVCGYPLGKGDPWSDKIAYPSIVISTGAVKTLYHQGRVLQALHIAVKLPNANTGGPVLDETGKVVGMITRDRYEIGQGVEVAIPVSILEAFLNKPDIAFVAPQLTRETLNNPQEFKASVVSFAPKAPDSTLKLILQAGDEAPREFPMKKQGTAWVATAAPAVKAADSVQISVLLGSASVSGTTADAVFKVAGKPVRLSGVKRIEFKEKPVVLLADGRTSVEGDLAGLGPVEIDLAGQKVKVDLTKATRVTVEAAPEVQTVTATVVALVDSKEVARSEVRMVVRDTIASAPVDPGSVKITPPTLGEDKVVKKLPDVFTDAVLGGGGRYLIFHMPKLKKLAIFDISEAKVTKYIPLTEEGIAYAAGLDCVVIALKKAGKLERWSLTTFELEKTVNSPVQAEIGSLALGHASNGPLVIDGQFFDLATFERLPIVDKDGKDASLGGGLVASGDGTLYTRWGFNGGASFIVENGVVKRSDSGERLHLIPGPDGKKVYTSKGIMTRTLLRAEPDDSGYGFCVPAVQGDYFLSITPGYASKGVGFTVYLGGMKRPVAKLDKAEHGLYLDSVGGDTYGIWRKAFFVPDAKVIAVLPAGNDRVVLFKIDADAALEKSGENYLLISSKPPREAKAGKTLAYAIKVKSKQGGVTYKLDSGPKGMTVSDSGIVTWAVPADAPAGDQDVIVTVRDKSGQDAFHTFAIKVVK
jgi:S1-C subfamily serine protease